MSDDTNNWMFAHRHPMGVYMQDYNTRRANEQQMLTRFRRLLIGTPTSIEGSVIDRYDSVGNIVARRAKDRTYLGCLPFDVPHVSVRHLPRKSKVKVSAFDLLNSCESNNAIHYATPPELRGPVCTLGGTVYYEGKDSPPDYPARRGHICKISDPRLLAYRAACNAPLPDEAIPQSDVQRRRAQAVESDRLLPMRATLQHAIQQPKRVSAIVLPQRTRVPAVPQRARVPVVPQRTRVPAVPQRPTAVQSRTPR